MAQHGDQLAERVLVGLVLIESAGDDGIGRLGRGLGILDGADIAGQLPPAELGGVDLEGLAGDVHVRDGIVEVRGLSLAGGERASSGKGGGSRRLDLSPAPAEVTLLKLGGGDRRGQKEDDGKGPGVDHDKRSIGSGRGPFKPFLNRLGLGAVAAAGGATGSARLRANPLNSFTMLMAAIPANVLGLAHEDRPGPPLVPGRGAARAQGAA